MNKDYRDLKVVHIARDVGYNKMESISPESKMESRKRMENPNIVTGRYKLKEIFAEIGIIVIPEKMSFL